MVFFQTNAIAFASLSQPSMFLTVIAERVQQALDKNCEVLNIALHSSKAIDRVWSFSQVQGLWCLQSNSLFNKTVLKKACNENPLKWPFFQTFSVNAAAPAQVSNFHLRSFRCHKLSTRYQCGRQIYSNSIIRIDYCEEKRTFIKRENTALLNSDALFSLAVKRIVSNSGFSCKGRCGTWRLKPTLHYYCYCLSCFIVFTVAVGFEPLLPFLFIKGSQIRFLSESTFSLLRFHKYTGRLAWLFKIKNFLKWSVYFKYGYPL